MKKIKTLNAVGHVLCHDLTRIVPGVTKDAAFRKGHVIVKKDIPKLLSMGKEHLYVWENDETVYHEDEGAEILYNMCAGPYMRPGKVKEGKIEVFAECDGLFEVDIERLNKVNSLGELMIATRGNNFPVKKGDKLAGTRVIPLVIEKEKMERAQNTAGEKPLLRIKPFKHKKVGIIVTGSEVFSGRIKDQFGPALENKMKEYDTKILDKVVVGDNPEDICKHIKSFLNKGADMVLCTGGMSVDPDDTTPSAIRNTGAKIVTYGAPVLPGAMFLLAYTEEDIPIMGLPGCVMYSLRTIFDLVLPKIMAGEKIELEDLTRLGAGGLCLDCKVCTYPNCGFGR